MVKSQQKVRQRFYLQQDDVEKWRQSCDVCAARKSRKVRSRGKFHQYNVGAPIEWIPLDILSALTKTFRDNKCILVIMDYFRKWPEAYPIHDLETSVITEVLVQEWVSTFHTPLQIHSEHGENFISAVFKGL